jgi:hypothetical protein
MKIAHDKLDASCKMLSEQLDTAKKTIEDLSIKKQQELDLVNKEISSLALKERDAK